MTPGHEHERDEDVGIGDAELELLAYLDGELAPERVPVVEQRLRTDRAYAARLRAMAAVGDFLRDDADRIYASARVDSIADDVLAKIHQQAGRPSLQAANENEERPVARVDDRSRPSTTDMVPLTSRPVRTTKATVIWVAFGGVVAAAAAMLLWIGGPGGKSVQPVASTSVAPPETVAVKTATPPPSTDPVPPLPEPPSTVEVEDLEVGQGATVVYTRGDDGSSPVVWITGREGAQ